MISSTSARENEMKNENGLVGHYTFGEESKTVLRDVSGNGNDGDIHGATFIKGKAGNALRFDGVDDYVDFGDAPGLKFKNAVTLCAWVYPEEVPKAYALIAGRRVRSFGLFQHPMTAHAIWFAVGQGKPYGSGVMGRRRWNHVVGTFDGNELKLYLDARLVIADKSPFGDVDNRDPFRMGGLDESFFKGIVSGVQIYDRALTEQEVADDFSRKPPVAEDEIDEILATEARTVALTEELSVGSYPYYFDRRVDVMLGVSGLGELPPGCKAEVTLAKPGQAETQRKKEIDLNSTSREACVTFADLDLSAGEYEIQARVLDRDGQKKGKSGRGTFVWPDTPSWPNQTPQMKVLNNLVTELLNVDDPAEAEYAFTNPRKHWVFISSTADPGASGRTRISIGSSENVVIDHDKLSESTMEAMRLLPAGGQKIKIEREGGATLKKLIVRAIPELGYSMFPEGPAVAEYGPYDWDFIEKHFMRNLNMIDGSTDMDDPQIKKAYEQWKAQGKKWVDETYIPGESYAKEKAETLTADEAYEYWANGDEGKPGFANPFVDGLLGNELHGGSEVAWAAWTEAIRRLHKDFPGKFLYPYSSAFYRDNGGIPFSKAMMDCGYAFSWEVYLPEAGTESAARKFVYEQFRDEMDQWKAAVPGVESAVMINFGHGITSVADTTLDVDPGVDFKVYMDMMFNLVANDPLFFGLFGIMAYTSTVADRELWLWGSKLMRHYFIEGNTSMLCDDPYVLTHIENPDFDDGVRGWTLSPAEEGSMAVKGKDGYGMLQGRYYNYRLPPDNGNRFMWTKRSARGPNVCSQQIRDLKPGRLYSVKTSTADYNDLVENKLVEQKHALRIEIDGGETLPEKSFQAVQKTWRAKPLEIFMSYHLTVFRAKSDTAKLVICDWVSDKEPGAPIGQELIYNYIEVMPFLED
jgi:hypothetical protein